ncbi:hypothetical protein [Nostoc sp. MS1]|nr:hypothetical protein [Nostoc sp. MS1]
MKISFPTPVTVEPEKLTQVTTTESTQPIEKPKGQALMRSLKL